ncbi:unnamed protein product [Bubo scandiacus]
MLLSLMEELKNKLLAEKKKKLRLELQIREENEEHGIGPGTYIDLEGVTGSLQNDVADTKKQAEETHRHVVSPEDPQEATGWLEKQLSKTTTELPQTKEKLTKKTNELIKTEEQLAQKPKDFEMQMTKSDESAEQLKEPTEPYASVSGVSEFLMVQSYSTCCETWGFVLCAAVNSPALGKVTVLAKEKSFSLEWK